MDVPLHPKKIKTKNQKYWGFFHELKLETIGLSIYYQFLRNWTTALKEWLYFPRRFQVSSSYLLEMQCKYVEHMHIKLFSGDYAQTILSKHNGWNLTLLVYHR